MRIIDLFQGVIKAQNQLVTAFTMSFLVSASAWAGPVYMIEEPGGITTFTSRRPRAGLKYKVLSTRSTKSTWRKTGQLNVIDSPYRSLVYHMAKLHKVDPALAQAVAHVESAFNPKARSPKGAMGIMQLMPFTAKQYDVTDAYQPLANIEAGVKHLKTLLTKYKGNERLALAAYNAGSGAVAKYNGIPPYRETQAYVKKVLTLRARYR